MALVGNYKCVFLLDFSMGLMYNQSIKIEEKKSFGNEVNYDD